MKLLRKTACAAAAVLLSGTIALSGCAGLFGTHGGEIKYPDFPLADDSTDSWLQRGEDDGITDINWFVDVMGWNTDMLTGNSWVAQRIREKTGVNVHFIAPLDAEGTQLKTLISAGKLPDVVTVLGTSLVQRQLAEEGYLYPIQGLAERWAPSLLPRISEDITAYYSASDGYLYSLPNNFYTQDDMKRYEEDQGGLILSNGGVIARKDWLEWYLDDAAEKGTYDEYIGTTVGTKTITTPREAAEYGVTKASNFLQMCKDVKENFHIKNSEETLLLSPWEPSQVSTGSRAMKWLYELFNVEFETKEGNLSDQFKDERLKEMLVWLNEAYRSKLITNLGLTTAQTSSKLRAGSSFVFIGSPQDYTTAIAQYNYSHPGAEYVPVIFTNDEGETPQLTSLAGPGFRVSMITRNCQRPDKVIKLFDYLWSDEGQKLISYGIEGTGKDDENATFYMVREPDETYKYGQIDYTDWFKELIINGENTTKYIVTMNLLQNRMFTNMTNVLGTSLSTYYTYTEYNSKAAISQFSYDSSFMYYSLDPTQKDYSKMITRDQRIRNTWYNDYVLQIIRASSKSYALTLFNEAMGYIGQYGYADLLAYQNASFLKRKAAYNVTFAHPENRADSGYSSLFVTSVCGDPSLSKTIPENVKLPT